MCCSHPPSPLPPSTFFVSLYVYLSLPLMCVCGGGVLICVGHLCLECVCVFTCVHLHVMIMGILRTFICYFSTMHFFFWQCIFSLNLKLTVSIEYLEHGPPESIFATLALELQAHDVDSRFFSYLYILIYLNYNYGCVPVCSMA